MALAGNVETIGLSSIFFFISTNSLSGLFSVRSDNGELSFLFDKGAIFFPEQERRTTYSLSGIIRHTTKIDKDLLEAAHGDEQKLLELIEAHSEDAAKEIKIARKAQFEEEIYDLFLWNRAYFQFVPGGEPEAMKSALETGRGFHFHTPSILMEAARRTDDHSRIRLMVPSLKMIFVVAEGKREQVDKAIEDAEIEGSHASFDGRATIEEVLREWRIPYTRGLAVVASLVETGCLSPLSSAKAIRHFRKTLQASQVQRSASILSYILETESKGQNRNYTGLEAEFISSRKYQVFPEDVRFEAKIPGPRAFRIMKLCLQKQIDFTLTLRQDDLTKTIVSQRNGLHIRSSKKSTSPRLIHFLQRVGAVTEAQSKALWKTSVKNLHTQLVAKRKITQEKWTEALAEKVAEELVEVYFWKEPLVMVINRGRLDQKTKASMKIAIPLEEQTAQVIQERLDEFAAIVKVVPSESAIFTLRHIDQPPPHPFYRKLDGQRSLADVRRSARAGPIEFFRFIYNGVKKRILRAVTLDEFAKNIQAALGRGDIRKARLFSDGVEAFGLANMVQDLIDKVNEQSKDLETSEQPIRLEGDLKHFSLAEVLQTLTQENMTGTLQLQSPSQNHSLDLYFYRGRGHWLEREEDDNDDFLGLFSDEASDLENQLAESFEGNFATFAEQANRAKLAEIKEEILNVFFWENAKFTFIKNELPEMFWVEDEKTTKIALDTQSFLLEVLNKLRILDDIRRVIPNASVLVEFATTQHKMDAIGAGEFSEVVMIIDGRHSVEQLASACSGSRFELYQFLYPLIQDGAVKVIQPQDFADAWDG